MNFNLKEFVSYFAVVLVGLFVDFGVLWALITFTPLWYFYAAAISFILALSCNYLLASHFVFAQSSEERTASNYTKFLVIGTSTLTLNQFAIYFLVDHMHLAVLLGKALTLPITFSWNYLANKLWVFKN